MERIFRFELEGRLVLGFDTGLDSAAFARARLSQILTSTGFAVSFSQERPVQRWKPKGIIERQGSMVIWGPSVGEGGPERLDRLIAAAGPVEEAPSGGADLALDALHRWVRSRRRLPAGKDVPAPFPAGALLFPGSQSPGPALGGVMLFPPETLIRRIFGAEEWLDGAEQWIHPDLSGEAADSFCAAALLYRILCGAEPFPAKDIETLHLDMRKGNFLPPRLAAPGMDSIPEALIAGSLSRGRLAPAPDLKTLEDFLQGQPNPAEPEQSAEALVYGLPQEIPGVLRAASYFKPLHDAEREKLVRDREKYEKKQSSAVKTRRFIKRNTALIGITAVILLISGLIAGSIISGRSNLPTTKGLSPREVVEQYYHALEYLDHITMEACILKDNKTGKDDINMAANLTVITKVRQAYEQEQTYVPAQEWLEAGSPPTDALVFGPVDLRIQDIETNPSDDELSFLAEYTLWLPGGEISLVQDELRLVFYKNAWRIAEITRE
jgi:hypothetical protein